MYRLIVTYFEGAGEVIEFIIFLWASCLWTDNNIVYILTIGLVILSTNCPFSLNIIVSYQQILSENIRVDFPHEIKSTFYVVVCSCVIIVLCGDCIKLAQYTRSRLGKFSRRQYYIGNDLKTRIVVEVGIFVIIVSLKY